jgi:hypothetical protein
MKRALFLLAGGCWLLVAAAGCAVNAATIEGHDLIDTAIANLRTGIDEYHADDAERMRDVRKRLTVAFVADVVAAAGDEARTAQKTEDFLGYLEKAEKAEAVEAKRYGNLVGTLRTIGEVNGSLRDLVAIRQGWGSELTEYVNKLRKKVENERNN